MSRTKTSRLAVRYFDDRILLGDKILQIWRELKQTTLLITHDPHLAPRADRVIRVGREAGAA